MPKKTVTLSMILYYSNVLTIVILVYIHHSINRNLDYYNSKYSLSYFIKYYTTVAFIMLSRTKLYDKQAYGTICF